MLEIFIRQAHPRLCQKEVLNNLTNTLLFSSQEGVAAWLTAKLLFCLNNSVSAESNMRKGRLSLLYYRVPIVRKYVIFPRSDVCFLSRFVSQLLNVSSMVIKLS